MWGTWDIISHSDPLPPSSGLIKHAHLFHEASLAIAISVDLGVKLVQLVCVRLLHGPMTDLVLQAGLRVSTVGTNVAVSIVCTESTCGTMGAVGTDSIVGSVCTENTRVAVGAVSAVSADSIGSDTCRVLVMHRRIVSTIARGRVGREER